jgi:hypothetical protein
MISSADTEVQDVPEKTMSPPSPSAAEVSEILKVMTEYIPFALLIPLRLVRLAFYNQRKPLRLWRRRSWGRRNSR